MLFSSARQAVVGLAVVLALALTLHARQAKAQRAAQPSALSAPVVSASAATRSDTSNVSRDRWFARDKGKHFLASVAIQIAAYGALRVADARPNAALVGASVVTMSAGIGKEVHDARGPGALSWRDLVWDGVGLGVGAGLVVLADGRR